MPDGRPQIDPATDSANHAPPSPRLHPSTPPGTAPLNGRVLLIAEACNPEFVSVPLVGWSHAEALRRRVDCHIVTQVRNVGALERAGLKNGVDFTAIDTERFTRPAYKLAALLRGGRGKGWTTLAAINSLVYSQFERMIWRAFKDRLRAGEFAVVHRLTPLSPTSVSLLAGRCRRAGVPFVMGPLNGGVPWPRQFDAARRQEKEWLSYVRGLYQLVPGVHSTRRNAAAILVASRDVWRQMSAKLHGKLFYVPENGIDPARFPPPAPRDHTTPRPLRVAFVGRLVPYKGADMLLEAAAPLIKAGQVHLTIAGNGPQLDGLKKQAADLGLTVGSGGGLGGGPGAGLEIPGWVDHKAVAATFAAADVFAFPSVREFGGGVCLEAMAVGCVPMVVDYAGPAELVTPATGYLVPLGSRADIVGQYRARLAELAADRSPLAAKSAATVRRAREQFTWDAKAAQSVAVYRWLTGQGEKPAFPMPTPDPA